MQEFSESQLETLWDVLDREQRLICYAIADKFRPLGIVREFAVNAVLDARGVKHIWDDNPRPDGQPIGNVIAEPQQLAQVNILVDDLIDKLRHRGVIEIGTCGRFAQEFLNTHKNQLKQMVQALGHFRGGDVDSFLLKQRDVAQIMINRPELIHETAYRFSPGFQEFILTKALTTVPSFISKN